MDPTDMLIVIPSRLGMGEPFSIKVKLRGAVRDIPCHNQFSTAKPRPAGPFNLNVQRGIQYKDDCLPEWTGTLDVVGEGLAGPSQLVFDGRSQGVFPGDVRPIGCFEGFRITQPGFAFVQLVDRASGLACWSNPAYVTAEPPADRIYWGDPHFHTIFSDAIRCPEELYAFARDEAFLDFAAMTDHMEALTDRMWDYFQSVTDDFNVPSRFATLQAQEWTNHLPKGGAPGHRNIYFRGRSGPALRASDPDCDTLDKFWSRLDAMADLPLITIPHHSSNKVMGIDWAQGWHPKYDKAIEVYSVWGSSERSAEAGNPRPIRACGGEVGGRHVVDALKRGLRVGFVGGGDTHDGRPGDELHTHQQSPAEYPTHLWPQGFTAAVTPTLSREGVFDAMASGQTYAATRRRIYLDVAPCEAARATRWTVRAAAEDGIRHAVLVRNGDDVARCEPAGDPRIIEQPFDADALEPGEFAYVRLTTTDGHMAWSRPFYGQAHRTP